MLNLLIVHGHMSGSFYCPRTVSGSVCCHGLCVRICLLSGFVSQDLFIVRVHVSGFVHSPWMCIVYNFSSLCLLRKTLVETLACYLISLPLIELSTHILCSLASFLTEHRHSIYCNALINLHFLPV